MRYVLKKIIFLFIFFMGLSLQVNAEDDVFTQPNEALGEVKIISMPTCADEAFTKKIIDTAKEHLNHVATFSILSKRAKLLKLKHLHDFEKADVKSFSPETDFQTANALIMIKINERVNAEDILLCRQKEAQQRRIYVIAYPYMDNVKAHIINLDENNPDYSAVQFFYP